MLLLLSSNASRRYSDDIVRALAQPEGATFQFRYDVDLLDDASLEDARANKLAGEYGLVTFLYVDKDKIGSTPKFVTCRGVEVKRTEVVGSSCILTLVARRYVHPLVNGEFTKKLSAAEKAVLPKWKSKEFKGKYVINCDVSILDDIAAEGIDKMIAFENVAKQLAELPTFKGELAFFAVRGLVSRNPSGSVPSDQEVFHPFVGDEIKLTSGEAYDLVAYTYAPSKGPATGQIKLGVESDEPAIFFTSSKVAALDSRYDSHRFTLTTDELLRPLPAVVRVFLELLDGAASERRCDVVLPIKFAERNVWWRMLLLTGGVAAPTIIAAAIKGEMTVLLGFATVVAAAIAAYGGIFPAVYKRK